jgi:hypothetical protein
MEEVIKVIDYKKNLKKEGDVPQKLLRFEEFTALMKKLALQGTEKYSGAEPHEKETIDIIPDVLGEEGYINFVLGDLIKRISRFKNQRRERDLVKMALWAYLLWMRLFLKQESKVPI